MLVAQLWGASVAVRKLCWSHSCEVRQWLSVNYAGRWTGRRREAPVSWPACAPDLNPLKIFSGDILKPTCLTVQRVLKELWCRTEQFASELNNTHETFERLRVLFLRRAELFVHEHGSNFEFLLWESKNWEAINSSSPSFLLIHNPLNLGSI
jgi:hypothetical protein